MKKILLSCFALASYFASAQIVAIESFEGSISSAYSLTGGINPDVYTINPHSCDGDKAVGALLKGTSTQNRTMDLIYTKPANVTSNGLPIYVSISLLTFPGDNTGATVMDGTATLDYSTDNGITYKNISTYRLDPNGDGCTAVDGTITPDASFGNNLKIRVRVVADEGAGVSVMAFLDTFYILQDTTDAPACTTVNVPTDGATNVSIRPTLSWPATQGTIGYYLTLGTTHGSDNLLSESTFANYFNVGKTTKLPPNTKIYASVSSYNTSGMTPTCKETSFTTGANQALPYCGPVIGEIVYPISNVNFAGINNSSNATVNGSSAHEFFLDKKATVKRDTTYPISITGTGEGTNRFGYTVYIDWNQNGSFLDAGESYFAASDFAGGVGSTITINKNIKVPATAKLGDTRMRIKYNFNASTTDTGKELNPCDDQTYGQAEDYTVTVQSDLATVETNKSFAAVYPNPFTEVLKISDVKDVTSILVTDTLGRTVKSLAAASELHLGELNKGIYFVTIKLKDGSSTTTKVIKE
ncbi:GEVED domain-containing protein [Soonwooa sp.]|uniref:GEVED domain-containing protein n=1 Tax=Soonwooa sp. TaxID=1938592 RepID=UPI0026026511|nr:GEVED domain-containing protein [Soonwooa sp.]